MVHQPERAKERNQLGTERSRHPSLSIPKLKNSLLLFKASFIGKFMIHLFIKAAGERAENKKLVLIATLKCSRTPSVWPAQRAAS